MNILVVCQYYYPEPFRLPDICEAMVARGHTVTVVTGTPNYPEGEIYPGYEKGRRSDENIGGVTIHRCPLIPRKRGILYRFLNYYSFVFSSCRYLRRVKENYDVVFLNQLSPVMMAQAGLNWAKRHGKKAVLYCLDLWPESLCAGGIRPGSPIYRFFAGVSCRIYNKADKILVTSKGFVPYLRDFLKIETPISYLPQYAENLFDNVPAREERGGPYHFVFAGNIGDAQSVETIIQAAGLLKEENAVFDIVGDGVSLEKCRQLAQGLNNVIFHGRRDIAEMERFYSMADAMLITMRDNPTLALTLPGKVQSYMAAGRAVIGAIGGETAALVKEADCGACVAAEDAAALAEAIREVLRAPEKLNTWGINARAWYQHYFRKEAFLDILEKELEAACEENEG